MDAVESHNKGNREALRALGVFLLITLVMTWPAPARLFWIKIDKNFDVAVFWWNLWWVKRSIWDLHTSPFWCDYLMYPHGLNVVFQAPSYLYGFFSIPVQLVFGLERGIALSTNLILIGSTALTGWGAWLLARRVTKDAGAAFVAGCAFAFTPFRFWHTGRFHLICTELIVFYAFCLWVALESDRKRYALAAGALFAAIIYSSPTYSLYAFWISILVALRFLVMGESGWRRVLSQSVLAGLAAFAIALPWLFAALKLLAANPGGVGKGVEEIVKYSGDIVGYFFPGRSQRLLGPILGGIGDGYYGIVGSEIFLGYVVLAAAAIAAIRCERRGAGFWLIGAGFFWILSLGPRLKVAGRILFPLPYELLLKLGPAFSMDRDPCRYVVVTTLCLSMAAAFGVKALAGKGGRRRVYVIVVVLLLAEFFQAPLDMRRITFPEIYLKMRRDPEYFAVLELPMETPFSRRFARIYQSMHQKPIIHSIPRRHIERYDFVDNNRFFSDLYNPAPLIEHPDEAIFNANRKFLVNSKVRYIIIYEKLSDPVIFGLWDNFLRRHRPVEIIKIDNLHAYRFY